MTTESPLFASVLVPTDFSDASLHALALGLRLVRPGGQITLLHVGVVPHLVASEYGFAGASGPLFAQLSAEVNKEQLAKLQQLAEDHLPAGLRACKRTSRRGPERVIFPYGPSPPPPPP